MQTVKPRATLYRSMGLPFWSVEGLGALGVGWTISDALQSWQKFILAYQTVRDVHSQPQ